MASEELLNLVGTLELHDLPLQGSSFTYFGSGQTAVRNKIYRFLVSNEVGA